MKRLTEIRIKYFVDGADGIIRVDEDTTNLEFAPTDNNEYVIDYEVINIAFPEMTYNGKSASPTLFIMPDSKYLHVVDSKGLERDFIDSGILLDKKTADSLGAVEGDTIYLNGKEIKVSGISRQYVSSLSYMNTNDLNDYDIKSVNAILFNTNNKDELINFASMTSKFSSIDFLRMDKYIMLSDQIFSTYLQICFNKKDYQTIIKLIKHLNKGLILEGIYNFSFRSNILNFFMYKTLL